MNSSPTTKHLEFEEIFNLYHNEILGFTITKVNDRNQALDIVQDVFLRFWEQVKKGEEIQNHRGFLYRVTRNRIIDHYRARKILVDLDEVEDTESATDETAESVLSIIDSSLSGVKVTELLETLPYSQKEILILRFVDELSVSDIAKLLETTPNTVSIRVYRALKELKQRVIEKYGNLI
jgi:RNA polymerase sigma-70 factor (ECF subfamily)